MLVGLGFGPSLAALGRDTRPAVVGLLSGPTGLALLVIVGTMATLEGIPVRTWILPFCVAGFGFSLGLTWWCLRNRAPVNDGGLRQMLPVALGGVVLGALLFAPIVLGGLPFT